MLPIARSILAMASAAAVRAAEAHGNATAPTVSASQTTIHIAIIGGEGEQR